MQEKATWQTKLMSISFVVRALKPCKSHLIRHRSTEAASLNESSLMKLKLNTKAWQRTVIIHVIPLVYVLAAASSPHSQISRDDSERKWSCQVWFMLPPLFSLLVPVDRLLKCSFRSCGTADMSTHITGGHVSYLQPHFHWPTSWPPNFHKYWKQSGLCQVWE